jgi:type VI secretion system secreted protein Hcp
MNEFFVKIDGIKGESRDSVHAGAIDALSWSWSLKHAPGTLRNSGGRNPRAAVGDMVFTHGIDRACPNIAAFCWRGQHIPEVKVICRKAGGIPHEFWLYTLSDTMITQCEQSGGGSTLIEQVSISFVRMKMEYVLQDSMGGKGGTITAVIDQSYERR